MESEFTNVKGMFKVNTDIVNKAIADVSAEDWFRKPGDDSNHMLWLLGHVIAGVRMIDRAADGIGLDRERLLALEHAVASHHGPLEGRRFETPEAVALHAANALDARVGEALAGPTR